MQACLVIELGSDDDFSYRDSFESIVKQMLSLCRDFFAIFLVLSLLKN